MVSESNILHIPLRVAVAERADEKIMDMINRQSLTELNADDIYTFSGIASNDRLDGHFTRMDAETTLRNYESDLKSGVPLLEWHDVNRHPYGRSYDGELIEKDKSISVRGHWYMIRDLVMNGSNTNDTIRAIKSGIIKDMSVGFGGSRAWYKCGMCDRDLFHYECEHIPGLENNDSGDRDFAWIMDANLREVSTVYKGSAPDAYIEKAREYVKQGELPENKIVNLEQQYHVRFERKGSAIFMPKKEGNRMTILEQLRTAIEEGKVEKKSVYDVLQTEGDVYRHAEDVQLRNELGADLVTVEAVRQLKSDAQLGKVYLADLIDRAVAARVKVQGDTFKAETYRTMLARSVDVEFLKDEIDSYEKQALEKFGGGGRQTRKEKIDGGDEKHEEFRDENLFN